MTNWKPNSIDEYRDVQTIWNYHHSALNKTEEERLQRLWRSSRDNARTPVQWSGDENAGFTTGQPWMSVNPNYPDINVEKQDSDPDSILNFYRRAVSLRKQLSCVRWGNYKEYKKNSKKLYMYSRQDPRQKLLVVCSFWSKPVRFKPPADFYIPGARLAMCNYNTITPDTLQPYECRVYLWK